MYDNNNQQTTSHFFHSTMGVIMMKIRKLVDSVLFLGVLVIVLGLFDQEPPFVQAQEPILSADCENGFHVHLDNDESIDFPNIDP